MLHETSQLSRWWQLLVVISLVPAYGYFAHAARDHQAVWFLVALCWGVTSVVALAITFQVLVRSPEPLSHRQRLRAIAAGLAVAAVVGWGGVRASFYELMAG